MLRKNLRAGVAVTALATLGVLGNGAVATAQQTPMPRPSLNLYGGTGLIDMPGAQPQPDGQVSAGVSYFGNTLRRNFSFQILPRVSGSLRYSTIYDWGQQDNPGYDLFDRSFDLQFLLLEENRNSWQPAVALGFRDLLGTGVYSSEYLVGTKTLLDDFTLTGGIGWGRLSGVGNVKNPFCSLSDSFCERDRDFGNGGKPAIDQYFHGEDMGFFGGVEWRTPVENLTFKAEYSSDAYEREQAGPDSEFEPNSPFNFGLEYSPNSALTMGAYYMYGSTVGVNVSLSANPMEPPVPQNLGAGPMPVNSRPEHYSRDGSWVNNPAARETLIQAIRDALRTDYIVVDEIRLTANAVDIFIINQRINQAPKAIGRTARVLAVGMPYSVETFRITTVEDGLPTTTVEIARSDIEDLVDQPDAGEESWEAVSLTGAVPSLEGEIWRRDVYPLYDWAILPVPVIQIFGGNEGFKPQLSLEFRGSVKLSRGLSFSGRIRQPVLGAFDVDEDDIDDPDKRELPQVRSNSSNYYAGYDPKLMRLTGDYLTKLDRNTYTRATVGYIERQFAGLSGEVLWKPVEQDWGVGMEVNWVKQRDPDDFMGFTDYDVVTGHASLYWNTGYKGLEAQFDAGRYLAGDWGGTVSVSRRFANGWAIGAFATKTNVSSDDFGEGSFDKGVTLVIPLRWSTPFETREAISGSLRSLSSDGGAVLNVANRIYPTIRDQDSYHLERNWGAFWQ